MKKPEDISAMAERLQLFHSGDDNEHLRSAFLRSMEDPLQPRTAKGHLRPNRILILWIVLAALSATTFVLFSLVQL